VGAALVRLSKNGGAFTANEVWRKRETGSEKFNHWSTPVFRDGHLYGMFSFKEHGKGPLKCLELATGKAVWSQPGFGPGNVTMVEDKLVVLGDKGQLVLAEATPRAYTEISRMQAVAGKCWSTPTYSDGRIYVRSTTEGACFDATGK
jgi:outer membrane protein assembly factor BamB